MGLGNPGPVRTFTGSIYSTTKAGRDRFFMAWDGWEPNASPLTSKRGYGYYVWSVNGTTLTPSQTGAYARVGNGTDYLSNRYSYGSFRDGAMFLSGVVVSIKNGEPVFTNTDSVQGPGSGGLTNYYYNAVHLGDAPQPLFFQSDGIYHQTFRIQGNFETTSYFSNSMSGVEGVEYSVPVTYGFNAPAPAIYNDKGHVMHAVGIDHFNTATSRVVREDDDYWYVAVVMNHNYQYVDQNGVYWFSQHRYWLWPQAKLVKVSKVSRQVESASTSVTWQWFIDYISEGYEGYNTYAPYVQGGFYRNGYPDNYNDGTWGFHVIADGYVVVIGTIQRQHYLADPAVPSGSNTGNINDIHAGLIDFTGDVPVWVDHVKVAGGYESPPGARGLYDAYTTNSFYRNGSLGVVTALRGTTTGARLVLFEIPVSPSGFGGVTDRGTLINYANHTSGATSDEQPVCVDLENCSVVMINDSYVNNYETHYVVFGSGNATTEDPLAFGEKQTITVARDSKQTRFSRGHDV